MLKTKRNTAARVRKRQTKKKESRSMKLFIETLDAAIRKAKTYKMKYRIQAGISVLVLLVLLIIVFPKPNSSAAPTQDTYTLTTQAEFDAGTFSDTLSENVSGGELRLAGGSGPDETLYVRDITISSANTSPQSEYQIFIDGFDTASLVTATKLQSDCDDLRFTNSGGTSLPYSIVGNTCNTSDTEIWVQVDTIAASGDTTIKMYYGAPAADKGSSELDTFSYTSEKVVGYTLTEGTTSMQVMTLEDGNTVTHNGVTRTLTNEMDTSSFTSIDQYGSVSAKKLFEMKNTTASDMIVPVSWAGTEFLLGNRSSAYDMNLTMIAPWGDSTIQIYVDGSACGGSRTVTSSGLQVTTCGNSAYDVVRVVSTNNVPFLVNKTDSSGNDPMPIHPADVGPWYGFDSSQTLVKAGPSGADYRWIDSNNASETNPGNLGANAYIDISSASGSSYYGGEVVSVRSADNVIGVQTYADSDGGDSTTHMLRRDFSTKFGSPFSTDFVAIVSDQNTTCRTYTSTGALYQTSSLESSNSVVFGLPGTVFGRGDSNTYRSGKWYVECDDPVMVTSQYSDDEQNNFGYPMMRQFTYPTPAVSNVGSEATALAVSGTWESNDSDSAIDVIWNGGWTNNGNGNAFEATVSGEANTDIDFEMRISDDKASWTSWFNLPDMDAEATRFGTPAATLEAQFPQATYYAHRYIQVKATLSQSDSVTNPTLYDISINYLKDVDSPSSNPTTMQCWDDNGKGTEYTSGNWYNDPEIYCEWSGATDTHSGVAGYYVHTDTDSGADPEVEGSNQSATSATFNVFTTNASNYLLLKTYDLVGNVTPSSFQGFEYKYDATDPVNPTSLVPTPAGFTSDQFNFTFNWNAGTDVSGSGVNEYCYKTGEVGFIETCTAELSVSGISAYQDGSNVFYVRTKDNVDNTPTFYTQVNYYYSGNLPTPPQGLSVTPPSNTSNSFTFDWFPPVQYTGTIQQYHYSVNALPSAENTTATTSLETSSRSVGPGAFATQQGNNIFYVVAEDDIGVNWDAYAQVSFDATTTAPGIPTGVTVTDSSIRAQSKYSLTITWDEPVDVGSGIDKYIIERSTDTDCDTDPLAVFTQRATATGLGYLDTGLTNTITYCYKIKASDNAGATSTASSIVSMLPEGRYTEPPTLIGSPGVEARIQSADVEWLTDREGSSFVEFGETPALGRILGQDDFVTTHMVTLLDLDPSTTYYYKVKYTDQDGNTGYSAIETFSTADAPSAPTNLAVSPTSNTQNSFQFSWDPPVDEGVDVQGYFYSINTTPTEQNTSFTASETLGPGPYATQQGTNVFYVVAIDDANNINYSNFAYVEFQASTPSPPIPTGVIITDASNRETEDYSIAIKWKRTDAEMSAAVAEDEDVYYVIHRSLDGSTFEEIATTKSTGYLDVDLDNSIEYYYFVKAKDSAGSISAASSTVSEIPEGRFTSPPEITNDPVVVPSSFSSIVTWGTERDADSHVEYGKTEELGEEQGTIEETENHFVKLEGLDASTTYYYRIRSRDSDGNVALSSIRTFTTLEAPTISNVEISDVRLYDALIRWETNLPLTTALEYGTTTAYGSLLSDTTGSSSKSHALKIEGLTDGTLYHVRLRGTDEEGNTVYSDDYTFSTLTFPQVSEITTENKTEGQTEIRWTTNVPTTSIVEYYSETVPRKTQGNEALQFEHAVLLFGLEDAERYTFVVRGVDQFGYKAASEESEFVTLEDTTPPEVFGVQTESNTIGSGETSTVQIVVSWKTDEPTTSQVEFGAGLGSSDFSDRTDENAELVMDHLVVIGELQPAKTYNIRVVSSDKAGNKTQSSSYTVLTSRKRQSFLQLLVGNLESTFSWLGNIGNLF